MISIRHRYGGILERGTREITMDDFWSLALDKMDAFVCLKPLEVDVEAVGEESSDEGESGDGEDGDDDDSDTDVDVDEVGDEESDEVTQKSRTDESAEPEEVEEEAIEESIPVRLLLERNVSSMLISLFFKDN